MEKSKSINKPLLSVKVLKLGTDRQSDIYHNGQSIYGWTDRLMDKHPTWMDKLVNKQTDNQR